MPAISGADATIIRKHSAVKDLYLNIFALEVFATADVVSASYPLDTIATNNESADWTNVDDDNYLVRIYDSTETTLKFEGTNRKSLDAGSLYVARMQDGDTGIALEYAQTITAGDKVKIYTVRVPKSFMSYIDGSDIWYKRSTLQYDPTYAIAQRQTRYGIPQPNLGSHQHERVDAVSGKATYTFSASNSFDFSAGTITYEWQLPTGVSFVAPSVATDATVTIEADPGQYVILCEITNGTTTFIRRGKRFIFATDDTYPAFSEQYAVTIDSDTQDREGRIVTYRVTANHGDDLSDYLYTGAPTLLTYSHEYSDDGWVTPETPTAGTLVENYFGYIRRYERIETNADGIDTYLIYTESPLKYFSSLPIATQSIVAKSSPAEWNEVHTSLAHIAYFAYYLMNFHASLLVEVHDFDYGDLDDFSRKWFETKGGDLYSALKKAVSLCVGANVGCKSDGSIVLRRNGVFESDAWRSANPTQWTWQAGDIVETLGYERNPIMDFGQTKGAGFVTGTSNNPVAVSAIAGVLAQAQGIGETSMESFIGADSNDIRDRVGHYHTFTNAPTKSVEFETLLGHDFTEPALMEWQAMAVTGYDPLDTGILDGNYKVLPISVNRAWDFGDKGTTKRINVSVQPETKGERAPLEPTTIVDVTFAPTWCYEFDFTADDFDWGTYTAFSGGATATYSAGVGWTSKDQQIFSGSAYRRSILVYKLFPKRNVTQIDLTYNLTKGTFDVEPAFSIQAITSTLGTGTRFYSIDSTSLSNGTGLTTSFTGSINIEGFWVTVSSSSRASASYSGSIVLKGITIYGRGANPFGQDNC